MPDSSVGDGVSPAGAFRLRVTFGLAAALFAGAAAVAGEPAGPAGEKADAARVERHSPRDGYPSIGPAGAKNTLVFFTDYQ
jgi:hypothetical protein